MSLVYCKTNTPLILKRLSFYALMAGVLSVCSISYGLTLKPYSPEKLSEASHVITYAQVSRKSSFWENKRIITRITLQVVKRYTHSEDKNAPHVPKLDAESVTLELLGGTLDGLSQVVHGTPQLKIGDRALFFMRCPREGAGSCGLVGMGLGVWREYTSGWLPDLARSKYHPDELSKNGSNTHLKGSLWYSEPMEFSKLKELCQFKQLNTHPVSTQHLPTDPSHSTHGN